MDKKANMVKFVGLLSLVFIASKTYADRAPNFILILTDDLGWSSLSVSMDKNYPNAKSDYFKTPNIDSIIQSGLRFSNGYAASPVCSPTRYSIQFGKSPARLQRTRGLGVNYVDHNQVGIPQVLKSINKSYRAAHLGKWHIDKDPSFYGYDVHDGITKNKMGGFNNDHMQWRGYSEDDPKRVNSLTERAIKFMRESVEKKQPFFLQISHYAVHSNIVYSESSFAEVGKREQGRLHKNQGYAAMIADLDLSIGSLLDVYNELGLVKDTYIIFLSDNGGMPVIPMQVNKGRPYPEGLNSPLLRGKWDLTEGGIRVPFAIAGPDIRARGQTDTPVMSYDLLPTLAELAGSQSYLPENLDGVSFTPLFDNSKAELDRPFDGLVFHYPHYNRVGMNEPHSAIRHGDYKLIYFPVSDRNLLFDLKNDPGELIDLSTSKPKLVQSLRKKLTAYLKSVDAELPENSRGWERIGQKGKVRTHFFKRYDRPEENNKQ